MTEDLRPPPKDRKLAELWQAYLWQREIEEMRKRRILRIDAVEKGKSNMNADFERHIMEVTDVDGMLRTATRELIRRGNLAGPIWEWLGEIKGLKSGKLRAQLLAQIDDISKFNTVSKLWRYCGYAVIGGEAERSRKGVKSPFSRQLKSTLWLIANQFVRQGTALYSDIYYEEKDRQRAKHPNAICIECEAIPVPKEGENGGWKCPKNGKHKLKYTDMHVHNMALRKMVKIFLQHLWVTWREMEGLPVNKPFVIEHLGHVDYIEP